jgi:hypothetical protein
MRYYAYSYKSSLYIGYVISSPFVNRIRTAVYKGLEGFLRLLQALMSLKKPSRPLYTALGTRRLKKPSRP